MIQLPTTPIISTAQSPRTLIIYGAPKVGKTTLLSILPNNLIIDAEQGSDYVSALKLKIDNLNELAGIEDAIKAAKKPYKYVSFDTIDKLEEFCEKEATTRYKASLVGKNFTGSTVLDLPKGAGFLWLRNVFYEYFQRIRQLAD